MTEQEQAVVDAARAYYHAVRTNTGEWDARRTQDAAARAIIAAVGDLDGHQPWAGHPPKSV